MGPGKDLRYATGLGRQPLAMASSPVIVTSQVKQPTGLCTVILCTARCHTILHVVESVVAILCCTLVYAVRRESHTTHARVGASIWTVTSLLMHCNMLLVIQRESLNSSYTFVPNRKSETLSPKPWHDCPKDQKQAGQLPNTMSFLCYKVMLSFSTESQASRFRSLSWFPGSGREIPKPHQTLKTQNLNSIPDAHNPKL